MNGVGGKLIAPQRHHQAQAPTSAPASARSSDAGQRQSFTELLVEAVATAAAGPATDARLTPSDTDTAPDEGHDHPEMGDAQLCMELVNIQLPGPGSSEIKEQVPGDFPPMPVEGGMPEAAIVSQAGSKEKDIPPGDAIDVTSITVHHWLGSRSQFRDILNAARPSTGRGPASTAGSISPQIDSVQQQARAPAASLQDGNAGLKPAASEGVVAVSKQAAPMTDSAISGEARTLAGIAAPSESTRRPERDGAPQAIERTGAADGRRPAEKERPPIAVETINGPAGSFTAAAASGGGAVASTAPQSAGQQFPPVVAQVLDSVTQQLQSYRSMPIDAFELSGKPYATIRSLAIQLKPENLGTVDIRLQLSDNQLRVEITPETPEARALLMEQTAGLGRALAAAGYTVAGLSIASGRGGAGAGLTAAEPIPEASRQARAAGSDGVDPNGSRSSRQGFSFSENKDRAGGRSRDRRSQS